MVGEQERRGGRFFGPRLNCEDVPLLPAEAVARMLNDPRQVSYLLVWKRRSDDTIREGVRVTPRHGDIEAQDGQDGTALVEVKRFDGTSNFIRTLLRPLPRNRGGVRFLICPNCQSPRRGLYGWKPDGWLPPRVVRTTWRCRKCNGLRYASEGGALVQRGRGAVARLMAMSGGFLRSDRPAPWYPHVSSSPYEAAKAGLCTVS